MAKLKDLLKESLGELPSSKLIKMKWNPVTEQGDVFDTGAESGDMEKDVEKLKKKFEGPLETVIKLINTKHELVQAVEVLFAKVDENKPGLVEKSKMLLKKSIQNL